MTRGKNICNRLKALRKSIAEENGIPLATEECTYKGECRGTCPRCEAEVRYLENALSDRLRVGKAATVAGLALGLTSCGGPSAVQGGDTVLTVDSAMADTNAVREADSSESPWREQDDLLDIVCGDIYVIDTNAMPDLSGIIARPDVEAEFPGGSAALDKFLIDNIQYPQQALENGIGGKVIVYFLVDTDGTIKNPYIMRDIGGGCGKEALRVVRMMPRWIPGKMGGKAVSMAVTLPVIVDIPE